MMGDEALQRELDDLQMQISALQNATAFLLAHIARGVSAHEALDRFEQTPARPLEATEEGGLRPIPPREAAYAAAERALVSVWRDTFRAVTEAR